MGTASAKKLVYPLKVDVCLYRELGEVAESEGRTVAAVLRRAATIYVAAARSIPVKPAADQDREPEAAVEV